MIHRDILFGEIELTPLLAEIVHTSAFQRLKAVHQGGAIYLIDSRINHTRYDHSLGVMYLVQLFGGSQEEQVAALLHDISHTAFSHVADKVFNRADEDYHEDIWMEVIQKSEIPEILSRYGYLPDTMLTANYDLLEQPYPNLCADRLDYTLRDLYMAGWLTREEALNFLNQLVVQDGQISYQMADADSWFKHHFQILNEQYFRKPQYLYINDQLAALLQFALQEQVLTRSDLMKDDQSVLNLLASDSRTLQQLNHLLEMKDFSSFDWHKAGLGLKERKI